jgi:hypothetical protein
MVLAPTHRRVLAAGLTWHYIERPEIVTEEIRAFLRLDAGSG